MSPTPDWDAIAAMLSQHSAAISSLTPPTRRAMSWQRQPGWPTNCAPVASQTTWPCTSRHPAAGWCWRASPQRATETASA